ncbi:hypothetical protein MKW98_005243 [Papaver atlanticum]|uniref:Uncharacterized protein n=1 Tax=Papaver atlanticum TaxID=357466 RepID=A0AAD4RXI5_9MAGN|nr:hypothetical protein MKW98_005243 [Papaver atlanticum]
MAMRVILTKISPFASLKTSSFGFVEGGQRIRRYIFDIEAFRSGKIDKGMTIKELKETFDAMSW